MRARADIKIGNLTHAGLQRAENQDYYGYFEPEDEAEFARKGRLVVVCDGMGGHAGGEVASRVAVETIIARYREEPEPGADSLRRALEAANAAIRRRAEQEPALERMGSTCVALALEGGRAHVAHVGDSRCYLVRGERLLPLTKDHSMVQLMVDEGLLTEEDMETHPRKNEILRSLGVSPSVSVDVRTLAIEEGDLFLLATDGLTGLASKEECRAVLLSKEDPGAAAGALVALANERGGPDNVTVQVVRVVDPAGGYVGLPVEVKEAPDVEERRAAVAPGRGVRGATQILQAPPREEVERLKAELAARPPAGRPGWFRRIFGRIFSREPASRAL